MIGAYFHGGQFQRLRARQRGHPRGRAA